MKMICEEQFTVWRKTSGSFFQAREIVVVLLSSMENLSLLVIYQKSFNKQHFPMSSFLVKSSFVHLCSNYHVLPQYQLLQSFVAPNTFFLRLSKIFVDSFKNSFYYDSHLSSLTNITTCKSSLA